MPFGTVPKSVRCAIEQVPLGTELKAVRCAVENFRSLLNRKLFVEL